MKKSALAMAAVVILSGIPMRSYAMPDTPPALSAADQSAVQSLVDRFADDWNRHDMQAMHELDTEDVEWINVVGHDWRGKDTVIRGHTAIHKGMSAATTMQVESVNIRPIAPDVAIAVAVMHFSASSDPRYKWIAGEPAKTRGSYTAVKRDGVWKIVHFQNTIIDPKAENMDETKFAETGFPPLK